MVKVLYYILLSELKTNKIVCFHIFSSAGSDYIPSPLPPIPGTAGIGRMGQLSSLPPPAVLFPPISDPTRGLNDASRYRSRFL